MNELSSMPDEKIDFSDIPPLDKEFWENAIVHHPHGTQPITLRVKKSVLNYFKASGVKGYQRRINAVLESYVQAQKPL